MPSLVQTKTVSIDFWQTQIARMSNCQKTSQFDIFKTILSSKNWSAVKPILTARNSVILTAIEVQFGPN